MKHYGVTFATQLRRLAALVESKCKQCSLAGATFATQKSKLTTYNLQLKTHGYTTSLYSVGSIGNVPVWNEPDELTDIANAYNAEDRLNSLRNNFRDAMIEDIENGNTNYQASVYYMDIINQYERMGDFMINISQDLERAFVKR